MGLNKGSDRMTVKSGFYLGVLCGVLLIANTAMAEWTDPAVVVTGGWGAADSEFDLSIGDSVIDFSRVTDVSSSGEVAISDERNGRVKIYRADGGLKYILVPPIDNPKMWTYIPEFIGKNSVIPIANYYFYSSDGQLLTQATVPGDDIFSREIEGGWYIANEQESEKTWLEYSSTGALLDTHTEKPLIMGRYKKDITVYAGEMLQKTAIQYPDMNWVRIHADDGCTEYRYLRDGSGNVYCAMKKYIMRFNVCGRLVADFAMPEDDIVDEDLGDGGEPIVRKINALYGDIVLADNGDIYSSRASDGGYAVLRWPWQASANDRNDGPFAPETLTAQINGSNVALTWTLSPHDAGCVTGYEVTRATTAGGPYIPLTTVAKSIAAYTDNTVQNGTTYYYAVRAISVIVNSPYSNEISVSVP